MVRFPGPFTKKGKKKRARANEQQDTPRSGYSSAEEATDFYSDLEEASFATLWVYSCKLSIGHILVWLQLMPSVLFAAHSA